MSELLTDKRMGPHGVARMLKDLAFMRIWSPFYHELASSAVGISHDDRGHGFSRWMDESNLPSLFVIFRKAGCGLRQNSDKKNVCY